MMPSSFYRITCIVFIIHRLYCIFHASYPSSTGIINFVCKFNYIDLFCCGCSCWLNGDVVLRAWEIDQGCIVYKFCVHARHFIFTLSVKQNLSFPRINKFYPAFFGKIFRLRFQLRSLESFHKHKFRFLWVQRFFRKTIHLFLVYRFYNEKWRALWLRQRLPH